MDAQDLDTESERPMEEDPHVWPEEGDFAGMGAAEAKSTELKEGIIASATRDESRCKGFPEGRREVLDCPPAVPSAALAHASIELR